MNNDIKLKLKKSAILLGMFCLGAICATLLLKNQNNCYGEKPQYDWDKFVQTTGEYELPPTTIVTPDFMRAPDYDVSEEVDCKQLRNDCADETAHLLRGKQIPELRTECQKYMYLCI